MNRMPLLGATRLALLFLFRAPRLTQRATRTQRERDGSVSTAMTAAPLRSCLVPSRPLLVVLDADSTLIRNEVIELIADEAGRGAEVTAATEAAMRGEVDFAASLRSRVAALDGCAGVGVRPRDLADRADSRCAGADRRRARAWRDRGCRLGRLPRDPRRDLPRARGGHLARQPARRQGRGAFGAGRRSYRRRGRQGLRAGRVGRRCTAFRPPPRSRSATARTTC